MAVFTGTVAVTGLNATDNPGPGVPVVRALRSSPEFAGRIIGLAYDAMDPGLFLPDLLDGAMLIPYPSAGRDALFARLAHARRTFGVDVLIPTLDSELPALCDHEHVLRAMGIGVYLPTRAQYDMRSKARLFELCENHDVPVPRSEVLNDPNALYSIHERFSFPIAVKGVFYGATIAYSASEAVAAFHKQAAEWGLPIIVQEFVAGEELNVAAIGDGEGGLIGAVPMKKLMLTKQGKGWAGVTIHDAPLMALARRAVAAMKWRGPLELEVIRDAAGGYHLLEINPRFPAWVDLSAGAGQNLPLACARLAAGESVGTLPDYRVGAAFVRASVNQLVDISAFEALTVHGERAKAS
ncbi:MAG: ATP-grasp domain-containing protein [Deltaproteobacteria bacterium]|nr:ATP-grasp domain-containing protein [Deltaproteobacteria bacterium]